MDRKIADIMHPSLHGEDSCDLCYRGAEARYTTPYGMVRVCVDCTDTASRGAKEPFSGELMISNQVRGVLAMRLQRLADLCQRTMNTLAKVEGELATKDEMIYRLKTKNWSLFNTHPNPPTEAREPIR